MPKDVLCPYCRKTVRAGRISWPWFLLLLLVGYGIVCLVYCLLVGGRICPECGKRIWRGS